MRGNLTITSQPPPSNQRCHNKTSIPSGSTEETRRETAPCTFHHPSNSPASPLLLPCFSPANPLTPSNHSIPIEDPSTNHVFAQFVGPPPEDQKRVHPWTDGLTFEPGLVHGKSRLCSSTAYSRFPRTRGSLRSGSRGSAGLRRKTDDGHVSARRNRLLSGPLLPAYSPIFHVRPQHHGKKTTT